jgi:hypothetical protein
LDSGRAGPGRAGPGRSGPGRAGWAVCRGRPAGRFGVSLIKVRQCLTADMSDMSGTNMRTHIEQQSVIVQCLSFTFERHLSC